MFSSTPCTTTCVIDGTAVTLHFYPETSDLRITDAYGACIEKAKWPAPWSALLATLRESVRTPDIEIDTAPRVIAKLLGIDASGIGGGETKLALATS